MMPNEFLIYELRPRQITSLAGYLYNILIFFLTKYTGYINILDFYI
jgi:hypothetical protein